MQRRFILLFGLTALVTPAPGPHVMIVLPDVDKPALQEINHDSKDEPYVPLKPYSGFAPRS